MIYCFGGSEMLGSSYLITEMRVVWQSQRIHKMHMTLQNKYDSYPHLPAFHIKNQRTFAAFGLETM